MEDLYAQLKALQRQEEFLDIQVGIICDISNCIYYIIPYRRKNILKMK